MTNPDVVLVSAAKETDDTSMHLGVMFALRPPLLPVAASTVYTSHLPGVNVSYVVLRKLNAKQCFMDLFDLFKSHLKVTLKHLGVFLVTSTCSNGSEPPPPPHTHTDDEIKGWAYTLISTDFP